MGKRLKIGYFKGFIFFGVPVLLIIVAIFCYITSWPVNILIVREAPIKSDGIIVFLGGRTTERIDLAHNLLQRGLAPKIYFCDGFEISGWKSYWYRKSGWVSYGKKYIHYLKSKNISPESYEMLKCPSIRDTASESLAIQNNLLKIGVKEVILVTSAYHSRRAKLIWSRVVPEIRSRMIGTRTPEIKLYWSSQRGVINIAYEYIALMKETIRAITASF